MGFWPPLTFGAREAPVKPTQIALKKKKTYLSFRRLVCKHHSLVNMLSNNSLLIPKSITVSDVATLNVGSLEGISIALGIGAIASIGLAIKGLFIYYIKYRAPKERPINTLMLYDTVSIYLVYRNFHTSCNLWVHM